MIEKPKPPLLLVTREGHSGDCPKCKSSLHLVAWMRTNKCLNPQCENYVDNLLTKEKEAINPNDLFWFHIAASIFIVIGGIGMFYGRVYDDLAVMAMSLATIISTAYVVWLVRD